VNIETIESIGPTFHTDISTSLGDLVITYNTTTIIGMQDNIRQLIHEFYFGSLKLNNSFLYNIGMLLFTKILLKNL